MKKIALITTIGATLLLLYGCGNNEVPNNLPSDKSDSPTTSVTGSDKSGSAINGNTSGSNEIFSPDNVESVVITGFTQDYATEQNGGLYYCVEYSLGEDSFYGYMDDKGVITSDIPLQYKKESYTSELYNDDGSVSYTQTYDNFDGVMCGNDGTFLWRETQSNIDGKKVCLGLMDCNGSWLYSGPVNVLEITDVDFDTYTECGYLGENMFFAYDLSKLYGNYLLIFNGNNGNCISIENVSCKNLAFYDGTMIYQQWDGGQAGGHRGSICSLHSDGTIQEFNTTGDLITVNGTGFLTTGNGISFYDRNGNLKWSFDKYEIAKNSKPVMYNDYVFVCVRGADGKNYTVSLNPNGEIAFDPFETYSQTVVGGHYALKENDNMLTIVDLVSGSNIATIDLPFESYQIGGLGSLIIIKSDEDYFLYSIDGEQVVPIVK